MRRGSFASRRCAAACRSRCRSTSPHRPACDSRGACRLPASCARSHAASCTESHATASTRATRATISADFREEGGYSAMASLLDEGVEMDAVFAANNLMTVGAVECLTEREVPIPGRVGVIGFDDIPWARLFRPGLSTVRQPTYELGRVAAQLLADRIDNPARPTARMVLQTELHLHESSRPRHQ
ncbi:substrate-binding domain-containing protein [Nonomuraea polychroma]|uniref:substrate-binding domain-containing protein n=1 Tax=Nonomuraea polychroma TaxID=46176 RepID=UPI003D8A0B42